MANSEFKMFYRKNILEKIISIKKWCSYVNDLWFGKVVHAVHKNLLLKKPRRFSETKRNDPLMLNKSLSYYISEWIDSKYRLHAPHNNYQCWHILLVILKINISAEFYIKEVKNCSESLIACSCRYYWIIDVT